MNTPPSLLFWVGEDNYALWEVIEEYRVMGPSKRIPVKAIPAGLEQGASKLFFAHAKAILQVTLGDETLEDLAYELVDEGVLTAAQLADFVDLTTPFRWWEEHEELQPNDFVPDAMLTVAVAFSKLPGDRRAQLERKYGIEYYPGVFGYSYFTGLQYVCHPDEDDLPEELEHLRGYVEPVRIVYDDLPQGEHVHDWQPTDNQGHTMECECGATWSIYEDEE